MEGALSKWTNVMKGWQYRWFVLDENAGLFSYYTRLVHTRTSSGGACPLMGSMRNVRVVISGCGCGRNCSLI